MTPARSSAIPNGAVNSRRAVSTLLALALSVLGPGTSAAAPKVDALVDAVVDAYGGKAALARVRGYRMEGSVSSVMRGTGPLVRTFARPDRLRTVLDYPGHRETRILDGARGWRSDPGGAMLAVDSFLLSSMTLQAARANLPWLLDERRDTLVALPPMDGGKTQGLEIALGPGLALTVYVETATGRIVRSSAVLATPALKTNFATDYGDFRSVDGVLFPFRESNFASNQSTGETVITTVVVNPPLTDADFKP